MVVLYSKQGFTHHLKVKLHDRGWKWSSGKSLLAPRRLADDKRPMYIFLYHDSKTITTATEEDDLAFITSEDYVINVKGSSLRYIYTPEEIIIPAT